MSGLAQYLSSVIISEIFNVKNFLRGAHAKQYKRILLTLSILEGTFFGHRQGTYAIDIWETYGFMIN